MVRSVPGQLKAAALESALPGLITPFNPQELCRHVQEIGTCEAARALGISELSAQAGKVVSEDKAKRAVRDVVGAIRGTVEIRWAASARIPNREGLTALRYAIGELHRDNVSVRGLLQFRL